MNPSENSLFRHPNGRCSTGGSKSRAFRPEYSIKKTADLSYSRFCSVHLSMTLSTGRTNVFQLQFFAWVCVFLIIFLSIISEDGFPEALNFSIISVGFYILIIYGNIRFLYPRYYETGKRWLYGVFSITALALLGLARGHLIMWVYNHFIAAAPVAMSVGMQLNFVITGGLVYLLSFIIRIAIAYFTLKREAEEILLRQSHVELKLLKSQVQPHFLFNTLNNIYFHAFKEAPGTARLIERLASIMKYFVTENQHDEVSLKTEIDFLESYIALESIRMHNKAEIHIVKEVDLDLKIPPMLLITFIENIFKHGIDRLESSNEVRISLRQQDRFLLFETVNLVNMKKSRPPVTGSGIENLRKRLTMLYGASYILRIEEDMNYYTARLKIPVL
jgi:sensor histidine kinase YesM